MGSSCTKAGREEAAFLKAAKDGDCALVQQAILIDVEWGYKIQTWNGQSVFHLAARYGRLDVLETVVEAIRFNPAGPAKWTKLMRMGHSTDTILRSFANLQDARCQSPLHMACIYGHSDVAERLLQLGATPWAWDELGGRTPLHYAASMGHVDVIRVVVSHNAPPPTGEALRRPNSSRTRLVDVCNDSGYTPLHYAVWAGNAASVRALTSYEASLSARNVACGSDWVVSCLKSTPLHLAAHKGNEAIVKLLLSAFVQSQPPQGSEAPAQNDRRRRDPRRHANANRQLPYHVAVSRNHMQLAERLHPDVPFSFILTPAEMESRLYGVAKLSVLAAKTLQAKLVSDIEAALGAMTAAAARGTAAGGGAAFSRARSGGLVALSGAVVAAAAAGQAGAPAAAAAQQVLAAATARRRAAGERSVHGAVAALESSAVPPLPPPQRQSCEQVRVYPNRPSEDSTASAPPTVVVPYGGTGGGAAPASTAAAAGAAAGTCIGAGGKDAASSSQSAGSSATSAGDSEKEALPVDPVPDLAARPRPSDAAEAGQELQHQQSLPLPPAPISPFFQPAPANASSAAPRGAAAPGGGMSNFNENASAFALFAAEPFDEQATGGTGGTGGLSLQPTGSNPVTVAALARSRAQQAAGGPPLGPAGSNSVSIAAMARNRMLGGGGSGNKVTPSRSRSLRTLLTGGRNRRSNTQQGPVQQQQQQRVEMTPAEQQAQDMDDADDLDDILSALHPNEGTDSPPAAAAATAASRAPSEDAVVAAGGRPPQIPSPTPQRRGGGAAGALNFWRRAPAGGQLSAAASAAALLSDGGAAMATPDGGSPYTGSLHAGLAAAAALAAAAGGTSGPTPAPPGVIESRSSVETPASASAAAGGATAAQPRGAPLAPGSPPCDLAEGAAAGGAPPLQQRSISTAALARGSLEGPLLPPQASGAEEVDGAVLTMLASLVEAPQHVLRRYRLLQLTHGLDLQDLLRDHSEQAAAVAAAAPHAAVRGGPPSALMRTRSEAAGLPVAPPLPAGGDWSSHQVVNRTTGADGADGVLPARWTQSAVPADGAGGGGAMEDSPSHPVDAAFAAAAAYGASMASSLYEPSAIVADAVSGPAPSAASTAVSRQPTANGASASANAVSANLAGHLLRALSSQAASESGDGVCGVCFDQPDYLSITGCSHRLCTDCSRELCKLNTFKPALCPFCRGFIGGFKYAGRR